MSELLTINVAETGFPRKNFSLLVLDEGAITCANLGEIRGLAARVADDGQLVLMMLNSQLVKGLRGLAKAQILGSMIRMKGVMPVDGDGMLREIDEDWRDVAVPFPVVVRSESVVLGGDGPVVTAEFPLTDDEEDKKWMRRTRVVVSKSNCWLDPAGCVFVGCQGEFLVEATSKSYNGSQCNLIPLVHQELELNSGERMFFCDSQHAERVGVAKAAEMGVSLREATMYVSKFPCRPCIQAVLEAGVTRVVFSSGSYGLADAPLLLDNGVAVNRCKI